MPKVKDSGGAEVTHALPVTPVISGLLLSGKVVGRRRKSILMKDGKKRYLLTFSILTDKQIHRVDRWSDVELPTDVPMLGAEVTIPVNVRAFASNAGVQYRLVQGDDDAGQSF